MLGCQSLQIGFRLYANIEFREERIKVFAICLNREIGIDGEKSDFDNI
jgi:hypothetical protein